MNELSLGVVATSRKEHERRLAIHPAHLERIDPGVRRRMVLERGYGEAFGIADPDLAPLVGSLAPREELFSGCDVVLLPKPLADDLEGLRAGQVVWGWVHCVQDRRMTQEAIDRRLTLIAWEAMHHWHADGSFDVHVFHQNNEMAGYCSVLHALGLVGSTGEYGRHLRAAVISYGATGRGAVTALAALGITDVTVLTHRGVTAVASPPHGVRMRHFERDAADPQRTIEHGPPGDRPLAEVLADHDIVVNCVLQDTDAPLMFAMDEDLERFAPGTLVVDVSCDRGMGFEWARPTTFEDPMFTVGPGVHYYAVDHSPSHLWNSATWVNSEALLEYVPTVLAGPAAWDADETIRRAIEIREGLVENPRILSFQGRAAEPPYGPA
ncbi:MAG: N(5)-(carboxyethyl)ornithine synthase [Solirubrobacteraceae bacterium]